MAKGTHANGGPVRRKTSLDTKVDNARVDSGPVTPSLTVGDLAFFLTLVFGGCCTNVWTLEQLLSVSRDIGSTITFCQILFVTLQALPSFLTWNKAWMPRIKPRQVPIQSWLAQVAVLSSGTLLNNWAFSFSIPLTLQIIFRSAGLGVSMLFGYTFMEKRYTTAQIGAVILVSAGVIVATLSKPSGFSQSDADPRKYTLGVTMLTVSLVLTGILGVLQEKTYQRYGPCWKEGVFYTHLLSIPVFLPLMPEVNSGLQMLAATAPSSIIAGVPSALVGLGINLASQLACVSGVNQLTSRTSSLSTQIVLTARKALSLVLSVMLFGSPWNNQLGVGAGMVFAGSVLYTLVSIGGNPSKDDKKDK